MNKEMIESENFVTVCTNKGLQKRERTNNIMEILKTENNIEEIENLECSFYKKNIQDYIITKYLKNITKVGLSITMIIALIGLGVNPLLSVYMLFAGLLLIFSGQMVGIFVGVKKADKIKNKVTGKEINLMDKTINAEREKLNKLKETATINKTYDIGIIGKVQKIERTELIDDLKRKFQLITEYQLNSEKYIEYSKDYFISPKLIDMGYSESDVNFIQMLIEQDIKLEDEKQKTLNLKKNKR